MASPAVIDDSAVLPSGLRLALRTAGSKTGSGTAFLLVHGLASNARVWDGVTRRLAAAGHRVVAVDQRGHGRSDVPDGGYDTDTCADDLRDLIAVLGLDRPVVAGQSWGGNVVLSLAARHAGLAAVACVDGGWISLRRAFATFDECWAVLAPPVLDGVTFADVRQWIAASHADWPEEGVAGTLGNLIELPDGRVRARLLREHHRSIVASLYAAEPAAWYPRIDVPVLLMPAWPAEPDEPDERAAASRAAVDEALAALPHGRLRAFHGADHDVHAQHPDLVAADLLALAAEVRRD